MYLSRLSTGILKRAKDKCLVWMASEGAKMDSRRLYYKTSSQEQTNNMYSTVKIHFRELRGIHFPTGDIERS